MSAKVCELCGQTATVLLQWNITHGGSTTGFDPPVACCESCEERLKAKVNECYSGLKIEFVTSAPGQSLIDMLTA
jgi:hypothetical protein